MNRIGIVPAPVAGVLGVNGCSSGGASGAGRTAGTGTGGTSAGDPSFQIGAMQTLLPDGNALGLRYFPDEATSILSTQPFQIMVADGFSRSSVVVTASGSRESKGSCLARHQLKGSVGCKRGVLIELGAFGSVAPDWPCAAGDGDA